MKNALDGFIEHNVVYYAYEKRRISTKDNQGLSLWKGI